MPDAAKYTFFFERLDTPGQIIAALPLTGVSWSMLINQSGTFKASLKLSDRRLVPNRDLAITATQPRQTICHIDRGGSIVGHGSILTRSYDLSTDTIDLGGQDLWYWLSKRVISDNLTYNEDQFKIQRDLITYTQAKPLGNLGITFMDPLPFSGVTLQRTYLAAQGTQAGGSGTADSSNIATACENFANLSTGFEFKVRTRWSGNTIIRQLQQAQTFGLGAGDTKLWFSFPRSGIKSFQWPEDGTQNEQVVYVLGNQGSDQTRPFAKSAAAPQFPLTEEVVSYSATDLPSLQAYADQQQKMNAGDQVLPAITVYGFVDPQFGTYSVGDYARYTIKSGTTGRWPNGMETIQRIVGMEATLRPDGLEEVKHMLAPF